ncbi:MAG: hypothetical protein A4E53_01020 [Pelotomaculum sp. PtaB.Bin104]|nr:MAG: hypothetical protein A4E53_01020 [Pelotomaculum sp. PtaB.Bin104]
MKIIYHCYGGAHSSVTAASIHLGLLPSDRVPGSESLWQLPFYDRQGNDEHGHFFFIGRDEYGHEVYFTARRGRPVVLEYVLKGLAEIFEIPSSDYLLVNVMQNVNWTMKLGGYLSRRCGLIKVGRPLVILGTRAAYFQIADLVRQVKNQVKDYSEELFVLQRKYFPPGSFGRCDSYRSPSKGRHAGQR